MDSGSTGSVAGRQLRLVGVFQARRHGRLLQVRHSTARLLAAAALVGPFSRSSAAQMLWPDTDADRAMASLRSALTRMVAMDPGFLELSGSVIALGEDVDVDVAQVMAWVNDTIYGSPTQAAVAAPPDSTGRELLSGWEDEWLTDTRERLRLLQSQALETAAERLIAAGRPGEALPYALAAVQAQPWSESANRIIIEIHARRGDRSNALRRFHRFRGALKRELGVAPGPDILAAIRQLYPFDVLAPDSPVAAAPGPATAL